MNSIDQQNRIIISATCFADAGASMGIAAVIAQIVKSDLLGLLVEEESILRFADLPSASVVALESRTQQRVTPSAMDKAYQRDAIAFKIILAKVAKDASINWSFQQTRPVDATGQIPRFEGRPYPSWPPIGEKCEG